MSDHAIAADRLADGLGRLAGRLVDGATDVQGLKRLSGGASQELWQFEVGQCRFVLRRAPGGDADRPAHKAALTTEAEVIQAVHRHGVPSPVVRHILSSEDGLGAGFIMDHVDGETIARKILREDMYAGVRSRMSDICGAILAHIHAVPAHALPPLREVTAEARIAEIEARYLATDTPRPVFDLAIRWLRAHIPTARRHTLVHGDFRNGNLIVGADAVRAVLDWEAVHWGDPHEDLGWICMTPWRFGCIDQAVGGFGSREALIEAYERASGFIVDTRAMHFWEMLGSLYWGVSCAGSAVSALDRDPRPVERAMIGRRASESELDILRLLAEMS